MDRRRIVITGLGVVAPNGIGVRSFWENLVAGVSAVDYVAAFDASAYPCKVAAEVRQFVPEQFMNPRRVKHRGRFSQFAVAAAKLAVEDAGIQITKGSNNIAVCVGNSLNGAGDIYENARIKFEEVGLKGIPVFSGIEFAAHAPASHISTELGLRGQAMTVASACSTGLDAIQWACTALREGQADAILAGGTEAPISEFCFATLCALGALSRFESPALRASRPYDLHRDGLVLGEGSAVCVLETLEGARERNARIYAEVLGFGGGNEGAYAARTDAAELALTDALKEALDDAGLPPKAIDYINAHGNALPDYDLIETRSFKRAFNDYAYNIPISSIKSMIGHALGAGSAFQVISSSLSLVEGLIPPTINLDTPDPECDLDYVSGHSRKARLRHVAINAHAMGGTHSVLILGTVRDS